MRITRAVITAAGRGQRTLPLQTLVDRDGTEKAVLCIIIEESLRAGIEAVPKPLPPKAGTHTPAVPRPPPSGQRKGRDLSSALQSGRRLPHSTPSRNGVCPRNFLTRPRPEASRRRARCR